MKTLIRAVLISCALSAPIIAFAQTAGGPLTRADVRADLVRVESAGYRPVGSDPYYPDDIQAAEAKVAAQKPDARPAQSNASAHAFNGRGASVSFASNDAAGLFEHH
ncbi:DUF4148 domain-containing protein [Burkholderia catarinensis]|uniref:DUF4148 domain-containing protein n=1 Tax=Burkholderia catarinensis TaxID=1108140 RepID=UPI000911C724|nr:DUF4148 domain-containing protein [Burkholderia catarinensis]KAG8154925.1 purine-nucleoside phosphorylase [Burkholderia catarinensis]